MNVGVGEGEAVGVGNCPGARVAVATGVDVVAALVGVAVGVWPGSKVGVAVGVCPGKSVATGVAVPPKITVAVAVGVGAMDGAGVGVPKTTGGGIVTPLLPPPQPPATKKPRGKTSAVVWSQNKGVNFCITII